MESTFTEILLPDKSSCIIGTVYEQPPIKPYSFNTSFSQLLQKLKKENKKTISTGDFNLNILNYAKTIGTYEFLESIFSNNFTPRINLPTRITGTSSILIDNILINSQKNVYTFGNLTTSMLITFHNFTITENLLSDTLVKKDVKTLKKDFSKFHSDNFIRYFKSVNWSVATQNNPNIGFENFMLIINNLLDKHAPFKEQANRKEKLRFLPWITKGILTSIKERDKIYKDMIKAKNLQTKELKFSLYKKYRNIIVDLLKKSKESHYRKFFEDNKKNCKAVWNGINEIIYSKSKVKSWEPSCILINCRAVSQPENIAEHFNDYFTSISK